MKKIAIVDGIRTPFIKAWTLFDNLSAQKLGGMCVNELLQRTEINPDLVDEVIMGCVGQPIEAANTARVISLYGGIPKDKKAYTVSQRAFRTQLRPSYLAESASAISAILPMPSPPPISITVGADVSSPSFFLNSILWTPRSELNAGRIGRP